MAKSNALEKPGQNGKVEKGTKLQPQMEKNYTDKVPFWYMLSWFFFLPLHRGLISTITHSANPYTD